MVANEITRGITKFSGFKPLLKVTIAISKESSTMPITVIMLDIQIMAKKLITPEKVKTWLIINDMRAKIVKIKNEATPALNMFFV